MGTSADRFTGYFFISASNRAESCGEKMLMVSIESFGLMPSTPAPTPQPPYPFLPRVHPRLSPSSTTVGAPEPALSLSKGLDSETWDPTISAVRSPSTPSPRCVRPHAAIRSAPHPAPTPARPRHAVP